MADLSKRQFARIAGQLGERISVPGDARYLAATSIWAAPTGELPYAVVHCRSKEDVQAAIRAARDCELPLSVRGGGHDWAGRALCSGIVIDLSAMNAVAVDAASFTARIGGGARAGDVVAASGPMDLAPVTGSVGHVGFAGLTTSGGYGPLIGRFGLALDNLIAAEVVLANGQVAKASAQDDAELLWALRGGGGNFGVITEMQHRLHDLPFVHAGQLLYPFTEAEAVLTRMADITASMPDELSIQVGIAGTPDGKRVFFIAPTWSGAASEGDARLAPLAKLGTLIGGEVTRMAYADSLHIFDAFVVYGLRTHMETCWLPALDRASIGPFVRAMENAPSSGCAIITHDFKGAAARVSADATAFGLRRDHVLVEIIAQILIRRTQTLPKNIGNGHVKRDNPSMPRPCRAAIPTCWAAAISSAQEWPMAATLHGSRAPSATTIRRTYFARPFRSRSTDAGATASLPKFAVGHKRRFRGVQDEAASRS